MLKLPRLSSNPPVQSKAVPPPATILSSQICHSTSLVYPVTTIPSDVVHQGEVGHGCCGTTHQNSATITSSVVVERTIRDAYRANEGFDPAAETTRFIILEGAAANLGRSSVHQDCASTGRGTNCH